MTDAQKELCLKLEAPSYTTDDYVVMYEAANEITYLIHQIEALERAEAELLADALRYRWLLSNYARVEVMAAAARIGLDKTIDAAMLAEKKEPT